MINFIAHIPATESKKAHGLCLICDAELEHIEADDRTNRRRDRDHYAREHPRDPDDATTFTSPGREVF